MDKDLKQMDHPNPCACTLKKIATLSFVAALHTSSCVSGRGQGFHDNLRDSSRDIDLSLYPKESPQFKELQANTADIVFKNFAQSDVQHQFFQAIKTGNLEQVKQCSKSPYITSKELVKGVMLALNCKDTFSFRYKHEKIVHFLLRNDRLVPEDLSMQDETGSTVVHLLIKRGDINTLKFLVKNLPLNILCTKDNKFRTPMHLTARCKSPKMFRTLLARIIDELGTDRAVAELFKTCTRGSVFACGYLRKHSDFADLLRIKDYHISTVVPVIPTFVQGSKMFKTILDALPIRLGLEQFNIIVREIDDIQDGYTISKQYGAELRGIVWNYIKKQYPEDSDKVTQYVGYIRHLSYIEQKYGSNSKEVSDYVAQRKKLVSYIEGKYGHSEPDEGYGSASETSLNGSILTS